MRKEITEEQITALMQAIPRAEEVDRLRAENERLRAALEYMVNVCPAIDPDGELAHELARNALAAKP